MLDRIGPINTRLVLWFVMFMIFFLYGCGKKPPVVTAIRKPDTRAEEIQRMRDVLKMANAMSLIDPNSRPPYAPLTLDTCDEQLDRLEMAVFDNKVSLEYRSHRDLQIQLNRPVVFGIAFFDTSRILINEELTSCGRLDILSHELAHYLSYTVVQDPEVREVVAQLASLIFMRRVGFDQTSELDNAAAVYLSYHMDGVRAIEPLLPFIPGIVDKMFVPSENK
jgi:hypothetical protein